MRQIAHRSVLLGVGTLIQGSFTDVHAGDTIFAVTGAITVPPSLA